MKSLRCNVRIGLTGTILQNNIEELWCVMDWAVPGCLGSRNQFKEEFSKPVEYGQRHNATKRELATGRRVMQKLAMKMSNLFLRRTKAIISNQLPKKEDRIVFCSLSDFQKAVYQTVLETKDVNLVLQGAEACSCNSGQKRRKCCYQINKYGETARALYFSYLAILRKVANHAALLQTDTSTSKTQDDHIKRVCSEVFSRFPEFIQQSKDAAFETISDPKYSGKMKVLQQLLNHCRKNKDKVLLFSFSTKLLDVLERYCMASGLDYRRLDGSTKAEERIKIVKEFNSMQDVNICLVSTMAGGLGLNFVGANVVVVFDPTWNPANDLQAIDRAYRIGQCRDVKVFRLISLGTVEEMIYLRQVYKQQLHCVVVGSENAKRYFKAVQGSKEHQGELFGVRNLFKLRTQGTCLTRDILEREGQVEAGVVSATMYVSQKSMASSTGRVADIDSDEDTVDEKLGQQFEKETFDFSSDSGEETKSSFRAKSRKSPANTDCHRQLTLQQCGFSKLLDREPRAEDNHTDLSRISKTNVPNDSNINVKDTLGLHKVSNTPYRLKGRRKGVNTPDWNISSDSGRKKKCQFSEEANVVQETECSSDESDDVILSSQIPEQGDRKKAVMTARYSTESDISEYSEVDYDILVPARGGRRTSDSSDYISDESDDIEIPKRNVLGNHSDSIRTKTQDKHSSHKKRNADDNSQTIDAFSSSDNDNLPIKKVKFSHQDLIYKRKNCRTQTWSKSQRPISESDSVTQSDPSRMHEDFVKDDRIVRKEDHFGSLDRILDGVEEVAYIHSNQNVVGSSKAENHLSRWAVRDVFELNQFSQLPANVTAHRIKKSEHISDEQFSLKTKKALETKNYNLLLCPEIHNQKKVHRMGEITFLVGETPKAMRRKQFEEMVSYFNMVSAEQFAHHIVKVNSESRQKMLREFYTSRYSAVEDLYPVQVPLMLKGEKEKEHTHKKHTQKLKKKRKSCINTYSDQRYKSEETLGPHDSRRSHKNVQQFDIDTFADGCLDSHSKDVEKSLKVAQEKTNAKHRHTCTTEEFSKNFKISEAHIGLSADTQKHTMEETSFQGENTTMVKQRLKTSSIVELLGDTSILDDLFTNQASRRTELPMKLRCEMPATKAKRRPKDFWDILSEQNDDSLSKLTDLSVKEKVCESTSLSSTNKRDWDNSLWVKNDKFLWRKNGPQQDVDCAFPGKSSDA
ncbi:DNA excision repair protein ERCC-6-like 2 isoform X2 [Ascaphus truei]